MSWLSPTMRLLLASYPDVNEMAELYARFIEETGVPRAEEFAAAFRAVPCGEERLSRRRLLIAGERWAAYRQSVFREEIMTKKASLAQQATEIARSRTAVGEQTWSDLQAYTAKRQRRKFALYVAFGILFAGFLIGVMLFMAHVARSL